MKVQSRGSLLVSSGLEGHMDGIISCVLFDLTVALTVLYFFKIWKRILMIVSHKDKGHRFFSHPLLECTML